MPDLPTVSVIVPNYNHARFLQERLDSILGQTFQDFEVIILDDASTDNSREMIAAYAARDPRIRTCFNERNSGSVFKQWNKGVGIARSELVWIAESDDRAAPGFLAAMVALLRSGKHIGLAYCDTEFLMDCSGETRSVARTHLRRVHAVRWLSDFTNEGRTECRDYLIYENSIVSASAVLFRRELYDRVGGANEAMQLAGDWHMWARILLRSDIAYKAATLNTSRIHPASVRSQRSFTRESVRELLSVRECILRDLSLATWETRRVRRRWVCRRLVERFLAAGGDMRLFGKIVWYLLAEECCVRQPCITREGK